MMSWFLLMGEASCAHSEEEMGQLYTVNHERALTRVVKRMSRSPVVESQ